MGSLSNRTICGCVKERVDEDGSRAHRRESMYKGNEGTWQPTVMMELLLRHYHMRTKTPVAEGQAQACSNKVTLRHANMSRF